MRRNEEDERETPDPELFRRCLEGESRAQELLYKRYFSFAMSLCMRYSRDKYEAMQIVNDSYMKVLRNIREFDSSKSFRSWYGRILINSAVDNYRRNLKHSSHLQISNEMEADEEQEPSISAELSVNEIPSCSTGCLIPALYEVEGYSHEEIGQMLDISTSTSRSNLARAKKMLRVLYNRNFNPENRNNEAV